MKLHLPKLLRHAVLACIAAVAGVASTVGTAAITSGAVTFALVGSYAEADVPNATYTDDGTTRTYTGTGVITVPAAGSGITKIVFGMSEPGSDDDRSYFYAGFTCSTDVQIGTSAGNGIDINDGTSGATYAFTGAISGEGIWRVMGSPTSNTKITGSMEGFTGQLIGGTAPTFQLATICKASVVEIGKLQLVGNVAFTGGSAGNHARITLGNVTSNADTQLTLGEYTETTLNGTIALRKSIVNNGSITLGSNVVFDLTNLTAVDGVYTLFENAVDLSSLTEDNLSGVVLLGKSFTFNSDGTVSYVSSSQELVWTGGPLQLAPGCDMGGGLTYANGDTITFSTSDTEVTLIESVTPLKIIVDEGVTVTLDGDGEYTLEALQAEVNGTLKLKDTSFRTTSLTYGTSGKLVLDLGVSGLADISTLPKTATNQCLIPIEIERGVLRFSGSKHTYGNVTVLSGAGLLVDGSSEVETTTIIGEGGWSFGGNRYDAALYTVSGAGLTGSLVLAGNATVGAVANKTLTLQEDVSGNHTLTKIGDGVLRFVHNSVTLSALDVQAGSVTLAVADNAGIDSIKLSALGATLNVEASGKQVTLGVGKSLSAVNGAILSSALTLSGGSLTLGSDSAAWVTDNGLSLNNKVLTFGEDKTTLTLNLGSVSLAAGDTIDLFKDVASVELATGATLDTYFSGLDEALKTATLSLTDGKLVATLTEAYGTSAESTDYYWESGAGNWSDAKWSTTDGATSGQTILPTSGTVNVVFNNTETASISIGSGASVNNMSVTAGTYTFTGDEAATLEVAGKLTVGSGATANIETAVEVGSIEVAGTLGISQSIKVAENGTVTLDAAGTINLQDFEPTTSTTSFVDSMNAFGTTVNTYKVFEGGSISGAIGTWQIDGTTTTAGTFNVVTGEYTITADGKIYGVGTGSVNSSSVTGAEGFALNGGTLVLDAAPTEAGFITATDKGGTLDLNGKTVEQSALGVLNGATVLEGVAASIYELGADKALASNLSLSDTDWKGTVKMGDIATPTEDLDISSLGRTGSSIEMDAVSVKKLTSSSAAAVQADSLTLGAASEVSGALTLTSNTLTLGSADASLTAASLTTDSVELTIAASSQDVLDALNTKASQGAITILTLTEGFTGNLTQDEIVVPTRAAAPVEKYFTQLQWNATKTQLSYVSRVNPDYVGALVEASTQNGLAGVALLQQALQQVNPQVTAPDSALAAVLNAVDAGELSEEGAAAVAGAATAVLGMAAHGDLDRQLQAIRNRTTTMGVDQSVVHHDMPYFNAWINAEGDYSELSDDGTEGGYKLNSWGGTVGFDVDITPTFTAGMALTAMYGDLDVTGADTASGELNTYYVSAFARYCASAWTHTFVATAGLSDITLDRTVMGEEINGETDGVSFGLMYEVGRVFALDEDGTACLQPIFNVTWRHTQVNGYTEDGSDLALDVDDQTLDTVTFGVGARLQAIVGESMYNRTSIFECRLLAKFDAGDRRGSSDVALAALGGDSQEVESAERGPIGLEAGAGLTIPLGDEGGSLFMDAAIELRADYTNVNGTVGYRINF